MKKQEQTKNQRGKENTSTKAGRDGGGGHTALLDADRARRRQCCPVLWAGPRSELSGPKTRPSTRLKCPEREHRPRGSPPAFQKRRYLALGVFPVLKRALSFQNDAGSKTKHTNSKREGRKRVLCCRKNLQSQVAPTRPGPCSGAPTQTTWALNHAFAEVCHFRVFYFLLVSSF